MPQDNLKSVMQKINDYQTTSELSVLTQQSAPSIRRMIRKMWSQDELKRKTVQRGHQKNVSAYKLK